MADAQPEKLVAFEFTSGPKRPRPHTLIFIGGLTDGLGSVTFLDTVVEALQGTDWSVFNLTLSSSYKGFGTSSLDQDVAEISQCVDYVRGYKQTAAVRPEQQRRGLVALMGHSTGSQDVLHYIYSTSGAETGTDSPAARPLIDGAILQSPVSDREAVNYLASQDPRVQSALNELVDIARKAVTVTDPDTLEEHEILLPNHLVDRLDMFPRNTPLTARRFLSLASPSSPSQPESDDLFSSDLADDRLADTFGQIGRRGVLQGSLLVLFGGSDEYVPPTVNKKKLVGRWKAAVQQGAPGRDLWDAACGIVPGATHALDDETLTGPRNDIAERVTGFLRRLESA
ncbi:hypothetical protein KEM52_004592 [Ascosphaera acerosa]|nr:hypothetical protein KEM52_004592 [Ascosphaera acerosa]